MSPDGEPDHSNTVGVDIVVAPITIDRLMTNEADGPLGILERSLRRWRLSLWLIPSPWHPVLQDDPGHPQFVQPSRDFLSFLVDHQVPIATPRTNHHRRSGVF